MKKRFRAYPIGYFHIDIADVQTAEGKLPLYVDIDRTSKFAFARLHAKADRSTAVAFLEALLEAVPYNLHTILTDNGIPFADLHGTGTGQPPDTASTALTRSAASMASSTGSPSPTIPGPMGRSSG